MQGPNKRFRAQDDLRGTRQVVREGAGSRFPKNLRELLVTLQVERNPPQGGRGREGKSLKTPMRRRRLSTYRPRLSLTRIAALRAFIKIVSACRPGCAHTARDKHLASATHHEERTNTRDRAHCRAGACKAAYGATISSQQGKSRARLLRSFRAQGGVCDSFHRRASGARTVRDLLLLSSGFEGSTCASSSGSCASADGSLRVSGRSSQGA
jgi:hypothetical protein